MIESGKARNLAILDETLPDHVTVIDLASGKPLLWDEQRALLQTHVESGVDAG
jgi:hypothetical protein